MFHARLFAGCQVNKGRQCWAVAAISCARAHQLSFQELFADIELQFVEAQAVLPCGGSLL